MPRRHCLLALGLVLSGCAKTSEEDLLFPEPKFVQWFSVSRHQDAVHAVPAQAPDGTTWYREAGDGIDLTWFKTNPLLAGPGAAPGEYCVVLFVKDKYRHDLYNWWHARIGSQVGVWIDGRLRATAEVKHEPAHIAVFGLKSQEEADAMAGRIRRGPPQATTTAATPPTPTPAER